MPLDAVPTTMTCREAGSHPAEEAGRVGDVGLDPSCGSAEETPSSGA